MNSPTYEESETPADDPGQSAAARRDAARALEELLLRATELDRAAGPSPDAEKWYQAQSESLLQWGEDTGRLLSAAEFGELISGFKLLHSGLEHQVFFKKKAGRIFKITSNPPYYGHTWELKNYLRNLIWCNEIFDDDVRIEGVVSTDDGVVLVTSQPFIDGRPPTEAEVKEWFEIQGCVQLGSQRWQFPNGMIVSDAHTGNLILMRDGALVPIDLHIERLGHNAAT